MQARTGTWRSPQGFEIFHRTWSDAGAPRAVALLVHGLGEHAGRYGHVAELLVAQGLVVHAYDHVGHGQSSARSPSQLRFEDYSEVLAAFRGWVRTQHPGLPLVLIGHSMGGLIAASDAAAHPQACDSLVLSAPAAKVSDNISPLTVLMGRMLSVLSPAAGVMALDPKWVSRDPAVVAAYAQDPLVHHERVPARLAAELLRAMQELATQMHRISAPLLVLQGTADRLVDPGGAALLMQRVSSSDKQVRYFEGLYHEVFNEPERAQVLAVLSEWLEAHLPPR